jgi:hypothetical protein
MAVALSWQEWYNGPSLACASGLASEVLGSDGCAMQIGSLCPVQADRLQHPIEPAPKSKGFGGEWQEEQTAGSRPG